METLQRKQALKANLIDFIKTTKNNTKLVFNVQTDIDKSYWVHNGVLFDSKLFNLNAAKKLKTSLLSKDTVYYISTIDSNRTKLLFGIN